jgi:hypothetical protein
MLVFINKEKIYIYIYMHALVRFAEMYIYFDKIDSCVEASLLP